MTPAAETAPAEAPRTAYGSFRDPSGRIFTREGRILRQVNTSYAAVYDRLIGSGLYEELVAKGLLVPHREVAEAGIAPSIAYRVLEPEPIPFISYPFEWSFGQLKAVALATLRIERLALERGLTLKDASAYNLQFRGAEPVLIDTLSFEAWTDRPWLAYRQFCQHFLGPLALMSRSDGRLGCLSRVFIDGPPLDLVARLLPLRSRLSPALQVHLHLHARAQSRHAGRPLEGRDATFSRRAMLGLIEHLHAAVERLPYRPAPATWADYYDRTTYSDAAMDDKQRGVLALVERVRPASVWDLGANTGRFSRVASAHGAYTVALDADRGAVERHFGECRARGDRRILPLVMDLANPTGPMGWGHEERLSLVDRGPADLVLALGLIHHLVLANQVPFGDAAAFLGRVGRALIIEFVPPSDPQVRAMRSRMPRPDADYSREAFEQAFSSAFVTIDSQPIADSERRLYLMRPRGSGG
jgi:hypothetical protein